MARLRCDDGATTGDDGHDDGEGVSRGGTPAPLSAGSGATLGGGAAGSEVREADERASASGTGGEATGGDDGGDDRARVRQRGGKKSRQSWSVRRANAAKGR